MNLEQALIKSGSVKFGKFTLSSGAESDFYVDVKSFMCNSPKVLKNLSMQAVACILNSETNEDVPPLNKEFDYVCGVAVGGIPFSTAFSYFCDIPHIIIRPKMKDYGIKSRFIGTTEEQLVGKHVLVLEDVATTGNSLLETVGVLRDNGAIVEKVVVVVDRLEGALDACFDQDVELLSLTTRTKLDKEFSSL